MIIYLTTFFNPSGLSTFRPKEQAVSKAKSWKVITVAKRVNMLFFVSIFMFKALNQILLRKMIDSINIFR